MEEVVGPLLATYFTCAGCHVEVKHAEYYLVDGLPYCLPCAGVEVE